MSRSVKNFKIFPTRVGNVFKNLKNVLKKSHKTFKNVSK